MTKSVSVTAWHFLRNDYRLSHDGRLVGAGDTVRVKGPPCLCVHGLHGSRRIIDAIRYAPGPILCRVTISGEIETSKDKLCGTCRSIQWTLDATDVLHRFACWCAEGALTAAEVLDQRCWDAIREKIRWLDGESTAQELAAAKTRAAAAASAATWAAAAAATWAAASAAASAADADAVAAARFVAARAAAADLVWAAATAAQNKKITAMVRAIEYE